MGALKRARRRAPLAAWLLGCWALSACATAEEGGPGGPGGPDAGLERADARVPPPDAPESGEAFDPSDPEHYVWSVEALDFHTLPILYGTVGVEYGWYAPGVDPTAGQASAGGELSAGTALLEGMDFGELIGGSLRFSTHRLEDGLPMTSCVKLVDRQDAVSSHNAILESGYPSADGAEDFTDPDAFREFLREQPGVVLLVEGDCTAPDPANPTEERSVLSWLAVTFEAEPDPELVDPSDPPDWEGGI